MFTNGSILTLSSTKLAATVYVHCSILTLSRTQLAATVYVHCSILTLSSTKLAATVYVHCSILTLSSTQLAATVYVHCSILSFHSIYSSPAIRDALIEACGINTLYISCHCNSYYDSACVPKWPLKPSQSIYFLKNSLGKHAPRTSRHILFKEMWFINCSCMHTHRTPM